MDKETVAQTHNGMLLRHKEGNSAICNMMEFKGIMLSDIRQRKIVSSLVYVESKKPQTHTYREQTGGGQRWGVSDMNQGVRRHRLPAVRSVSPGV